MRADISIDRSGWLYRLDYKKLIIIVFLLRLITASAYDIFVNMNGRDILLPDSKFYSLRGRYVDLVLQGHDRASFTKDMLPGDRVGNEMFIDTLTTEKGRLPTAFNQVNIFSYIVGIIYFIFGYSTVWVRIFNIFLSMGSVYLLFNVAKRYFGVLAGNLFLIVALFLPTQFIYSITLSRDFLRVFIVSVIIWAVYTIGDIWGKKLKLQY
jgi:hypothetical protein